MNALEPLHARLAMSDVAGRPCACLVDSAVDVCHAEDMTRLTMPCHVAYGGERAKSLAVLEAWAGWLHEQRFGRDLLLVAIGGGALLDVAGLLGSLYLRGIDVIYVPSTLLAIADAAWGGKTAVDILGAKNLLGTFRDPLDVVVCRGLLASLGPRHVTDAVSEIIKTGFVADAALVDEIERYADDRRHSVRYPADMLHLALRASEVKRAIVASDPTQKTELVREVLNFGHTVGHALEATSGFQMSHGAAVAWGMMAEALVSDECRHIAPRLQWLLRRHGLLGDDHALSEFDLSFHIARERKRDGARPYAVVPTRVGGPCKRVPLDPDLRPHWRIP